MSKEPDADRFSPKTVLITGAAGNLGSKLALYLVQTKWCKRIIALDCDDDKLTARFAGIEKIKTISVDLVTARQDELNAVVSGVDTIVHFAVTNPMPDCSWDEALDAIGMIARLLEAARANACQRFVFASSNHALGQYGRAPMIATLTPGCLTTNLAAPGTAWETVAGPIVAYAYGASKLAGERLCCVAASRGGLTSVSIRVGWCQADDNHPRTLNAGGNAKLASSAKALDADEEALRWYRNMWLSNRDFLHLFECAILSEPQAWDSPGIVVNGMSANAGMAWDIGSTRRLVGYHPKDNVWDYI